MNPQLNIEEKKSMSSILQQVFKKMNNLGKGKISSDILKQRKQADTFIGNSMEDYYFSMIKNGYEPTKKQNDIISDKLDYYIKYSWSDVSVSKFNKHILNGFTLDSNIVIKLLLQSKFTEQYNLKELLEPDENRFQKIFNSEKTSADSWFYFSNKDFFDSFRKNFLSAECQNKICATWKELFHDPDSKIIYLESPKTYYDSFQRLKLCNFFIKTMPEIVLADTSIDNYLIGINNWKIKQTKERFSLSSLIQKLHYPINNYYKNELNHILDKTKEVYADNYLEKLTIKNSHEISSKISLNSLPQEANDKICFIQSIYINLKTKNLNEKETFDITNIMEKRVPEVLNKYLAIDPESRIELTNSVGQNAKDLMMIALNNFATKLEDIQTIKNEENLRSLNVVSKYSQKI